MTELVSKKDFELLKKGKKLQLKGFEIYRKLNSINVKLMMKEDTTDLEEKFRHQFSDFEDDLTAG